MHKLLKRQLRRLQLDKFAKREITGKHRITWQRLLDSIDRTYGQIDRDRRLLQCSLDLVSSELSRRNDEVKARVDELEATKSRLEDVVATLNTTLDAVGDAIFAYDDRGHLVNCNRMAIDMLDMNAGKCRNPALQSLLRVLLRVYRKAKNPALVADKLRRISDAPGCDLFGLLEFADGRVYQYQSSAKLRGGQLRGRVWCLRNITETRKNQALIHHQVYHDSLTGLPNRLLFLDRLQYAIACARRNNYLVAVLFIDLDHFKKVNDTCGHHRGDQLLRDMAVRIRGCLRQHDTLSRLGGDEFVVLLEGLRSCGTATTTSSRILEAACQPYSIDKRRFYVSCSIGISIFPRDGFDPKELIRKADMAMYHAKELGRNNFQYFNAALERLAIHHVELEQRLRAAMENRELSLFYQPRVDAQSGHILGFEALARWFPPGKKAVSPSEFVQVAEKTGLIKPLGEWVLQETCRQIRRWLDKGAKDFTVSINLSTRELLEKDLIGSIGLAVERYRIPENVLELEITETVLMENLAYAQELLHRIRRMGIAVAVDDFGTGYSSMRYLQRLPIDYLKIDRSFILDLAANRHNAAIASSIISLGHNLSLKVIAEGVEDRPSLEFLRSRNCDQIQGFYCHRPMRAHRALQLLLAEPPLAAADPQPADCETVGADC